MGNSAKRDARAAEQAEKQRKALELRKAGASYDQIADQLKLGNRSVAFKLVKAGIKAIVKEPAESVLHLELARLDAMLLGCWTKAKLGDPQAIDRVLRIQDRRAAYLGLDRPRYLKAELTGRDGAPLVGAVTPEAAAALVRQHFGEKVAVAADATDEESTGSAEEVQPGAPDE
jgi:hypothetical protein